MAWTELADRLHSLAIHLLRRVRGADVSSGLTASRLSALSVLVYGGARSVGELAAAEQVTAPTMSRLVTGLEREGLVERLADPADGRRVRVEVTAAGVAAMQAARSARVARVEELLSSLDASDRATVRAAVELLEAAIEDRRS